MFVVFNLICVSLSPENSSCSKGKDSHNRQVGNYKALDNAIPGNSEALEITADYCYFTEEM